jgi:hypothetical protein
MVSQRLRFCCEVDTVLCSFSFYRFFLLCQLSVCVHHGDLRSIDHSKRYSPKDCSLEFGGESPAPLSLWDFMWGAPQSTLPFSVFYSFFKGFRGTHQKTCGFFFFLFLSATFVASGVCLLCKEIFFRDWVSLCSLRSTWTPGLNWSSYLSFLNGEGLTFLQVLLSLFF